MKRISLIVLILITAIFILTSCFHNRKPDLTDPSQSGTSDTINKSPAASQSGNSDTNSEPPATSQSGNSGTNTEPPETSQNENADISNGSTHIHQFGEWLLSVQSTCENEGTEERFCNCGEKQVRSVAAITHTASDWIVNKDATCTSVGSRYRECTTCFTTITTQEIPTIDHVEGFYVTIQEATCTTAGLKQSSCRYCDTVIGTEVIEPLEHNYKSSTVAATCTEPGGTKYTCRNCSDSYVEQSGEARGHDLKISGKCSRCDSDLSTDMRTRISAPLEDGKYGFTYRVGGLLYLGAEATNISDNTIKYCWFQVIAYNTVGDVILSETIKITGPIAPGERLIFNRVHIDAIWPPLSNSDDFDTISKVEISNIRLEYMDGTVECGPYGYSTTEIGENFH